MEIWSWPTYYMTFGLHDTDNTCTTLHLSDIPCTTLYLLLPPFTLFRDLDTHYIHYLSLIFLVPIPDPVTWVTHYFVFTLINKISQAGVAGGVVAGEIQGGVLGRATPCGFECHTWSCYLCALLLLHVTWYLSTVNCFSLLSGST